jgi:HTH-type transcriptional regulator/antitoxin MqsA
MHPSKCHECGGRVYATVEPVAIELRGEKVSVTGVKHGRCAECGEVFLSLNDADRVQKQAVGQLREARGLLTPEEILGLRASLRLSQAGLEKLLGVGPKTVVRWEKGTVFQSATADCLMRLLIAMPELRDVLERNGVQGARTRKTPVGAVEGRHR